MPEWPSICRRMPTSLRRRAPRPEADADGGNAVLPEERSDVEEAFPVELVAARRCRPRVEGDEPAGTHPEDRLVARPAETGPFRIEAVQDRLLLVPARTERSVARGVAECVGRERRIVLPGEIVGGVEKVVARFGVDHGRSLDEAALPAFLRLEQRRGRAGEGEPIRRQLLHPELHRLMD